MYLILEGIFSAYSPMIHADACFDSSSEAKSSILIVKFNTLEWLYFY